ncbi:hypothetical protein CDAR_511871 [Caerostris darwini]|uniref:Uncharacterized protein n=1 Tax=Caerostris darwini TaxID=1538125 RepID=A0AAV4P6T4_9ARAC|nr:hypothetical protein CDAR_511871 [Caerostris darwini]
MLAANVVSKPANAPVGVSNSCAPIWQPYWRFLLVRSPLVTLHLLLQRFHYNQVDRIPDSSSSPSVRGFMVEKKEAFNTVKPHKVKSLRK